MTIVRMALVIAIAVSQVGHGSDFKERAAEMHWSEAREVDLPGGVWRLVSRPRSGDDGAIVSIGTNRQPGLRALFALERDATAFWSPDGESLAVVDKYSADTYRLRFYSAPFQASEQEALATDRTMATLIRRQLTPTDEIEFYWPHVVGWSDGQWIVAVGVETAHGEDGPFRARCFGYSVDARSIRVREMLSARTLRDRFHANCIE